MFCKKYTLTNNGNSNANFSYLRCSDSLPITSNLKPNQQVTIFVLMLNSTKTSFRMPTLYENTVNVVSENFFPPPNPLPTFFGSKKCSPNLIRSSEIEKEYKERGKPCITILTIELGYTIGQVNIQYYSRGVPEQYIMTWGNLVIDTGFRGDSVYQSELKQAGYPQGLSGPSSGVIEFKKTSIEPVFCEMKVVSPLPGSLWDIRVNCPIEDCLEFTIVGAEPFECEFTESIGITGLYIGQVITITSNVAVEWKLNKIGPEFASISANIVSPTTIILTIVSFDYGNIETLYNKCTDQLLQQYISYRLNAKPINGCLEKVFYIFGAAY